MWPAEKKKSLWKRLGINPKNKDDYTFKSIPLKSKKRISLVEILEELHARYRTNIILTETGSYRSRRPEWWAYILQEAQAAKKKGLPLFGVCSYPTLDIKRGAGFIVPQ